MFKINLSFIILLTLSGIGFAQQAMTPPEVKALLARIRQKRDAAPQMQADFQENKNVHLLNKPIANSGKFWFQAPNKFRREAKGNSPSVTVSDGQLLWIYYPKFQSAERYSLGKHSPLDAGLAAILAGVNLENLENNYHITAVKFPKGYELDLAPRPPSLKRLIQKFTIRINDQLQLEQTEMSQPNGDRTVTVYTNESSAPINPVTFEFSPPAGTNITTPLGH